MIGATAPVKRWAHRLGLVVDAAGRSGRPARGLVLQDHDELLEGVPGLFRLTAATVTFADVRASCGDHTAPSGSTTSTPISPCGCWNIGSAGARPTVPYSIGRE